MSRRTNKIRVIAFIIAMAIAICFILHREGYIYIPILDQIVPQREVENPDEQNPVYTDDEIQFHFLTLGNKYTGDCTLVKVGNTEVLIDAGSRQSSAETIVSYVSEYCTDGILEYVIATHADQDHISAFVGTTTAPGIFESFDCRTIIDFPLTN